MDIMNFVLPVVLFSLYGCSHCSHHLHPAQHHTDVTDTWVSVDTKKSFLLYIHLILGSLSVQTVSVTYPQCVSCVILNHLFILPRFLQTDSLPYIAWLQCRPDGSSIRIGCFVFIIEINTHSS